MLGWLLSLAATIAFFLPWLKFPARNAERVHPARSAIIQEINRDSNRPLWKSYLTLTSEEWNRALRDAGIGVTGFEIPEIYQVSRHHHDAVLLNASGLLGSERQADRACFAYALPVLAFFSAAFITFVPRKGALLLPFLATLGLYFLLRFKLNETYLERLTSSLDVGLGLWLSLYALLGLAVVLLLRLLLPSGTRL